MDLKAIYDRFVEALEAASPEELRQLHLKAIEDSSDSYLLGDVDGEEDDDYFAQKV